MIEDVAYVVAALLWTGLPIFLAVYFWNRVVGGEDQAQALRRAVRWTLITILCLAAILVVWLLLASIRRR